MRVYYHNITKMANSPNRNDVYNESDINDFFDSYEEGDIVFTSESGNCILRRVDDIELMELKKYYFNENI